MNGWPSLDHVCGDCATKYHVGLATALSRIADVPQATSRAVDLAPPDRWHDRPAPQLWSITEYACHLRDVFVVYTLRLHRARTEDGPDLEPMFNDLRAHWFRYNRRYLPGVLDELDDSVAGFSDEVSTFRDEDWARTAVRRDDERSAGWMLRNVMHEGVHHVRDINQAAAVFRDGW
jgi:hypothetical protein